MLSPAHPTQSFPPMNKRYLRLAHPALPLGLSKGNLAAFLSHQTGCLAEAENNAQHCRGDQWHPEGGRGMLGFARLCNLLDQLLLPLTLGASTRSESKGEASPSHGSHP